MNDLNRRSFLGHLAILTAGSLTASAASEEHGIPGLIRKAGNTPVEAERYRLLQKLAGRSDLEDEMRTELEKLLPWADRWANAQSRALADDEDALRRGYLKNIFRGFSIDKDLPPAVPASSPLYPIWCMYRGRLLIHQTIEIGEIMGNQEPRERHYGEGRRLLGIALKAFPLNPVLGAYLGTPIPWKAGIRRDPGAPAWANLQREGMERLRQIIHWWIDERQLSDGQYGGGWGDDVEMWRWMTPILVGFQDEKVNAAQRKLANALFEQEHMRLGYTTRMSDVEHTAEDSGDIITSMLHIDPADEIWRARARKLVDYMKNQWTGRNERGFLQFKSTYFTANDIDLTPRRACDTVYHPRAVQPALLLWQRTGDPQLTELFADWLSTWVDAAGRAERGKPAGIIPSAIHWPDGKVGGVGKNWWKPENYTENPLYVWPSAMRMMTSSLLLAYHMTEDKKFLSPLFSMAEIRMTHLSGGLSGAEKPGTKAWCAERMSGFLTPTLAKYRALAGDTQFDELLQREQDAFAAFCFFDDENALQLGLQRNRDALAVNWPMYTSEVRWTDRILSFNKNYLNYYEDPPLPTPNTDLLYSLPTGDPGDALYFPMNAVKWLTEPKDIAARVVRARTDCFEAELYYFGKGERAISAELFLLKPGNYTTNWIDDKNNLLATKSARLDEGRKLIRGRLPRGRVMKVIVAPA